MKNLFSLFGTILMFALVISCEKKPVRPTVSTSAITGISTTTAVSGGNITDDGGAAIISRGVCWNTSDKPTTENSKTIESGESGFFTSNIAQLLPNTTYYVRAYVTNSVGTGYGNSVSFKTLGGKPSASISEALNIQLTSVTLNGSVNPNLLSTTVTFEYGGATNYGSYVTALQSPLTGGSIVNVTADLTELNPGTTYHFRIKAENSLGITYSSDMACITLGQTPTATTENATDIQPYSAILNGSVNPNLLLTTVAFEYGETSNYGSTIAALQSPLTGDSNGNVTAALTGLTPGTAYHFRVKAINELGTTNGDDLTFTTLGSVPTSTTQSATNIQVNLATINGSVNPNYLPSTVEYEWGTTTSYGNSITPAQSPLTGSETVEISADLSGLTPGTVYHFRIKATNELGTTNGDDMTFTTLGHVPTATTLDPIDIQMTTVTINGLVNPNYLPTTVTFEWGTTTSYGSTITPVQSPLTGSTSTSVNTDLTGLIQGTTYHFRIKATNELGTTNSYDITFTTLTPVTDVEGNVYNIRTFGTQVWMTENLKTTKYRNGDLIETTTPSTLDISGESTPEYQWAYNGDESNAATYGRLYTYYVVTDSRNICPTGWHVPADEEWTVLTDYLENNHYGYEGSGTDIAKSMAATALWPNDVSEAGVPGNDIASNNSSGFSGLPAGWRTTDADGITNFYNIGAVTFWWTSSAYRINSEYKLVYSRLLNFGVTDLLRQYGNPTDGFSVRCLKD
jgi:uncharacterized protein (TIGR02145 family)